MRVERFVLLLVGGTIALLLAGVVVTLLVTRAPETVYPEDSPEGTVATYLRLLEDGEVEQAYALVSMRIDREQFRQQFSYWSERAHRVTLVRSSMQGDSATVVVDISTFSGGAFGPSDQTRRQSFTLRRQNGSWRITSPEYLYF